jgi:hypothetical protein
MTYADLTKPTTRIVETPTGKVTIRSLKWAEVAPLLELTEAEQAPALIAASVVGTDMTRAEAGELPVPVVMALVDAITELNGLRGEPE